MLVAIVYVAEDVTEIPPSHEVPQVLLISISARDLDVVDERVADAVAALTDASDRGHGSLNNYIDVVPITQPMPDAVMESNHMPGILELESFLDGLIRNASSYGSLSGARLPATNG